MNLVPMSMPEATVPTKATITESTIMSSRKIRILGPGGASLRAKTSGKVKFVKTPQVAETKDIKSEKKGTCG